MNTALVNMEHLELEYQELRFPSALNDLFRSAPQGEWAIKREASCEGAHVWRVNAKENMKLVAAKIFLDATDEPWSMFQDRKTKKSPVRDW